MTVEMEDVVKFRLSSLKVWMGKPEESVGTHVGISLLIPTVAMLRVREITEKHRSAIKNISGLKWCVCLWTKYCRGRI